MRRNRRILEAAREQAVADDCLLVRAVRDVIAARHDVDDGLGDGEAVTWQELRAVLLIALGQVDGSKVKYLPEAIDRRLDDFEVARLHTRLKAESVYMPTKVMVYSKHLAPLWHPGLGMTRAELARRVFASDTTLSPAEYGQLIEDADREDQEAERLAEIELPFNEADRGR